MSIRFELQENQMFSELRLDSDFERIIREFYTEKFGEKLQEIEDLQAEISDLERSYESQCNDNEENESTIREQDRKISDLEYQVKYLESLIPTNLG